MSNRIRFIKVRDVKTPNRGNKGDAGIDFYVPNELKASEIRDLNKKTYNGLRIFEWVEKVDNKGIEDHISLQQNGMVDHILLHPGARVIIPSGIKVLIEPEDSWLVAIDKSGVSTKKGLMATAKAVDSNYTGEIHICVTNIGLEKQIIVPGEKLIQFMHLPVYLTEPELIDEEEFKSISENWGNRGENWQGSTDNK